MTLWAFTFVRVNERVKQIDTVAGVVQDVPEDRHGVVELPEHTSADDEDEVVQDGTRHHRQPLQHTNTIYTLIRKRTQT